MGVHSIGSPSRLAGHRTDNAFDIGSLNTFADPRAIALRSRIFPWGDPWASGRRASSVHPDRLSSTAPVGSIPPGLRWYNPVMVRRVYAHNFRCFQNTEMDIADRRHVLLVGRNGSGKSSLLDIVQSFRLLAFGRNQADEFLPDRSVTALPSSAPQPHPQIRLEIDMDIPQCGVASYSLSLEQPPAFQKMRVAEERLVVDGDNVLERNLASVRFAGADGKRIEFSLDWHLISLSVIGVPTDDHPIERFRRELRRLVLLRPVPSTMVGEGGAQVAVPDPSCRAFGDWFRETMNAHPGAYEPFRTYLKEALPGFEAAANRSSGLGVWSLEYEFRSNSGGPYSISFGDLSDGEKCLSVAALTCALAEAAPPITVFWDEPDSFVALPEIQRLIVALRRAARNDGQFIATSHDAEAIRAFTRENTLILFRSSHSEPSRLRPANDLVAPSDDLADALARGDDIA